MPDLILTNADIWNAIVGDNPQAPGPLMELVQKDTPLPASNLLRRSLRLAQAAFADLDADRQKLVAQYVHADCDVTTVDAEFNEGFAKLMAVEVVLPGAVAVRVSDLGNISFSGAKLYKIAKFVIDDPEPSTPELVK